MSGSNLKPATRTEAEARAEKRAAELELPWSYDGEETVASQDWDGDGYSIFPVDQNGECIGHVAEVDDEAKAAFIVLACNSHDALTDILERLVTGIRDMRRRKVIDESDDDQWLNVRLAQAEAALKAAKGEA